MAKAELSWCADNHVARSTDTAIEWVAERNLRNQEHLFAAFGVAQLEAGVDSDVIAQRLGLDPGELEDLLKHPGDLTVDELRLLSIAAEVVVQYRVRAAHHEHSDQYRALRRMVHHVATERRAAPHSHTDVRATWQRAVAEL
jgi:hypothetical protein